MTNILVTGASGVLGRAVMAEFGRQGIGVTGLSRKAQSVEAPGGRWVQGDLLQSDTLHDAFSLVDVVVHCASNPRKPDQDVMATRNLCQAARGVSHLLYVSVAGIAEAAGSFPYYRAKLTCEHLIATGPIPFTVVRSTQFHEFLDFVLRNLQMGPLQLLPSMKVQPVEVQFAAERIVAHALARPRNLPTNVHGPEVLHAEELVATWQQAFQSRKITVRLPAIGMLGVLGRIQTVEGETGGRTWSTWLSKRQQRSNPYRLS